MCGNGIRSVAKFVYDKGLTDKTSISVETLAGIRIKDKFDYNKLNKILKDKYSIKIIDTNSSQMIKI